MKNFVQYVNPNIGTIGQLLQVLSPTVLMPHGMMKVSPMFNPEVRDRYLADKIFAFPTGFGMLMPVLEDKGTFAGNASSFDHDFETVSPCEYTVLLEDSGIDCAFTVDKHAILYAIDMPSDGYVLFYMPLDSRAEKDALYVGEHTEIGGEIGICRFSAPMDFEEVETDIANKKCYRYHAKQGRLYIKAAMSYIDTAQAAENLQKEIPGFDYQAVKQNCFDAWNKKLGTIEVFGGTKEQLTCFYTAMYRVMGRMNSISEYGRYYSGYDNAVHQDEGHEFYVEDGMWDTFRCAHPLQRMIEPDVHRDIVESYIRMYQQCGMLPDFPGVHGNRPIMLGNHTAALFADSLANGVEFDVKTAFEAVKHNALEWTMLPWRDMKATELDEFYHKNGYFPALEEGEPEPMDYVDSFEKRQSVSLTLEHSYDDWCAAQLAKHLGLKEEEAFFLKRSQNYKNVYNQEIGFMAPRTSSGDWVKDFNPKNCGGLGGRYYFAENNAWIYTFNVQHDNEGLMDLMGGVDKFNEKLDRLFIEPPAPNKYEFIGQYPDATGLVGQFCMGNEPSFHIPYLYNYSGQPWKTQRKVREMLNLWFFNSPIGLCGDEDGGAMSAWYVFSAIGFYPVCPGSGLYDFGSPIFDGCIIDNGKARFTIQAEGASGRAKYIESVTINGEKFDGVRFPASLIDQGGEMVLKMNERPCK